MTQQDVASYQGILCVMGSGETAPTMVKVHRSLLNRIPLGDHAPLCSILDTPYGFQENADELSLKTIDYFKVSLKRNFQVASFRSLSLSGTYKQDVFYDQVQNSHYLFAGPGSPTYALKVWKELGLGSLLSKTLLEPRVITFSSAAALTLGSFTLPVYEIYKAGEEVRWEKGLGLFDKIFAQKIAIVPHYNNQEGGTHDTRYCYMGEGRIKILENTLPDDGFILGVDEHSGIVFDLASQSIETVGIGVVTLRKDGLSKQIPVGSKMEIETFLEIPFSHRRNRSNSEASNPIFPLHDHATQDEEARTSDQEAIANPLEMELIRLKKEFDTEIEISNFAQASKKILDLESTLAEWSTDSLLSDLDKQGRSLLRSMIIRLGTEAAAKAIDKSCILAPFVEFLLEERSKARSVRNFERSDEIRNFLLCVGIEVQDSPEGTSWSLRDAIVSSTGI